MLPFEYCLFLCLFVFFINSYICIYSLFVFLCTDTVKRCNHKDVTIYQPHSVRAYFKPSYYATSPYICSHCIDCKKEFGSEIKVTELNMVWMCPNAHDSTHHCKEAKCNLCFNKWQDKHNSGTRRSGQRQRRTRSSS